MRNFKKFLALVLAMLMVSACAVSVSAFDDVKEDDKFATAIETLADLGVIKGRNDGTDNFYPNDTLTREEAAVIAAKILVGAKSIEWNEATTRFTDVTAKWSFAYINYVDDENVMVGRGGDTFDPKANLRVDEAIKIALAVADPSALRNAEIEFAKNPSLGWSVYYVNEADSCGLTEGVSVRKYDAECTRGMFAQFIYNALTKYETLSEGFNLATLAGELTVVANDTATIGTTKVVRSVFEAALKDSGFEGTLTDYVGAKFTVKYNAANGSVYSAVLDSDMKVFDSTDAILSINKDANGAYINTLTFDGKVYRANALGTNGGSGLIGGAGAYPEITISYLGTNLDTDLAENNGAVLNGLPTYYKGFAYDDNSDDNYDRIVIKEYKLATIKANTATAANGITFDTVSFMTAGSFTNKGLQSDKAPIAYTGEVAAKIDDKTPNLVHVSYNAGSNTYVVDVLEVATLKTGELTGITKDTSITIDGEVLKYNAEVVAPASTTLKQNVSVWTIYGKYVKFASYAAIDTSAKTLLVESVKIVNGSAVVTGYNVKNGYAKEELTVVGIAGDKLVSYAAFRDAATANAPAGLVYLATGEGKTAQVIFNDAYTYDFTITDKGAYVDVDSAKDFVADYRVGRGTGYYYKLSIKNGYLMSSGYDATIDYSAAPAVAIAAVNSPVVVKITNTDETNDVYNNWTMTVATSLSEIQKVQAKLVKNADDQVTTVIYGQASVSGTTIIASPIAEGQTIVQVIADAHEYGFEADVYKAIDLINGKVVSVTGTADKGSYYVANTADYKLVGEKIDDLWVLDNATEETLSNITFGKTGILYTVKAYNTQLEKPLKPANAEYTAQRVGDYKEFSIVNQIKVYEAEAGIILTKDNGANPVSHAAADFVKAQYDLFDKNNDGVFYVKADAEEPAYNYNKENATGYVNTNVYYTTVDTYVVNGTMIIVIDVDEEVVYTHYNKLPAGTIVKVLDDVTKENAKVNTYKAFDLLAGTVVTIETEDTLDEGTYYVANDGEFEVTNAKWMKRRTITKSGETYTATRAYATKTGESVVYDYVETTDYTAKQIKAYDVENDGTFTELALADVLDIAVDAYVVAGQIIIVK